MPYPPIAEHGLIGDLQTAALVASDGTVDFYCYPRFDSPTAFASLLDDKRGGRFALAPRGDHVTKQMYLPNTAILVTRFLSPEGVAEVVDFLPIDNPTVVTDRHRLIRMVRGIRGRVELVASVEPRPDYARGSAKAVVNANGTVAVFEGAVPDLHLLSSWPLQGHDGDVRAVFAVEAGDVGALVLASGPLTGQREVKAEEIGQLLDETTRYWQDWLAHGTYRGRWREAIERSAITLKLMTYAPTGAMVAAPTTGLPEQVGGERNWDYRYTWVRDASFSVFALLHLGFVNEAAGLSVWIRDRIEQKAGRDGPPLSIMYRVDGSSDLKEESLDHLDGYMGSKPVRIGNGAADQLQLDIYGEAMDSISALDRQVSIIGDRGWRDLVRMLDWLCDNWEQPDEGVWETRGGRRPFTYARLMSWVAFDRSIRLAVERARPANLAKWEAARDDIYRAIMDKDWNPDINAFVQYEGGDVLDASNLLMPVVGFVAPTDAKWVSTLAAMDRILVSDSLVYRYDPKASPDGLRGSEGTFSLCTFFYVHALTRTGRLEEAHLTFEKMLTYANHVGLFSEEIGLSGEQLGNFPQAFTHLSLINAAVDLNAALDNPSDPNRLTAGIRAAMGA
jgi:GH15 family glucan-1,4-alpha-glucosidase